MLAKRNFEKRAVCLGGAIMSGFILTLLFKSEFVSALEKERDRALQWAPSISSIHVLCLGIFLLSGLSMAKHIVKKQPPIQSVDYVTPEEFDDQAKNTTKEHVRKLKASQEYRRYVAEANRRPDCDAQAIFQRISNDADDSTTMERVFEEIDLALRPPQNSQRSSL